MHSLIKWKVVKKLEVRVEYDYSKLRGKIKELFGRQEDFAAAMKMSTVALSAKLNNKVQFTQDEINKACNLLSISFDFIPIYFFTEKVKSS